MPNQDSKLPSALDVAELILQRCGPLDALKLQKLVYYCQAWCLAWNGRPLFREQIQAWIHGPVVPELYQMQTGRDATPTVGGNVACLDDSARSVIEEVLRYYGELEALALRNLTHDEDPWMNARDGLPENQPSTVVITHDVMRQFYAARPCGGGRPAMDLSGFSEERVRQSKKELAREEWVGIDGLASAIPA